jgi:hypothetical protein
VPAARSTTAAVTTRAASAGTHIRARKSGPLRCSWPRTIRFVRFEPTRNSEPALDSSRHPDSREPRPLPGGVHQPRRQERDRGIQVQRRGRDADHDGRAREQRAPVRATRASCCPSSLATRPISSSPVTRANGGQSCDAAAASSAGLAMTAATSPAIPVPASRQDWRSCEVALEYVPAVRQRLNCRGRGAGPAKPLAAQAHPARGFRCHPGGGRSIRPMKHAAIPLITSSKPSMSSGLTTYALACSS